MATQLFLLDTSPGYGTGTNDANLAGSGVSWQPKALGLSRGSAATVGSRNTVAGTTNGIEVQAATNLVWYSPPLDAAVTISGSITWNLWAAENNMSANVAINGILEVIDGATGAITLIDKTARTTEVAVTTRAVNNFAETPAAGVACKRGDRLRVRIFGDDAGTMASGFSFTFGYNGTTAAVDGDSYLTLTENLTFVSEPAGSQIFLTTVFSPVSSSDLNQEAWTSRGSGVTTGTTAAVNGFAAPVNVTDNTGDPQTLCWFTKELTAFTLGGAVRCNIRGLESLGSVNAGFRCEIAVTAGDGSGAVVWGATTSDVEIDTTEAAVSFLVSGDDVAVTAGQRLRIRVLIDDPGAAMTGSGQTVTLYYAGTSGGASGDTYLTFTQTLTEFVAAAARVPYFRPYAQLMNH